MISQQTFFFIELQYIDHVCIWFSVLITLLETQTIQLASAGDQHSIAVTESGQVFAWGDNTHGQLGVGFTDETHIQSPKYVSVHL